MRVSFYTLRGRDRTDPSCLPAGPADGQACVPCYDLHSPRSSFRTPHSALRISSSGQALIETCLVMAMICILFMGLFQISQIFAAKEVLHHTAARGARSKTVGFNWWMVEKSMRVAMIPNAGKITEPAFSNNDPALIAAVGARRPGDLWTWALKARPTSDQYNLERALIPEYLGSDNHLRAGYVLDYEFWDTIDADHGGSVILGNTGVYDPVITVSAAQDYPLWVPFHRTFYADDSVRLRADCSIENYYPIYLDDQNY